ncbi:MAG: ComEC/Rec2 family competence protein [Chloroflexi bacterium]|nr:ComEC/Rec2 family competence protein [Chloroflexota bacterium]
MRGVGFGTLFLAGAALGLARAVDPLGAALAAAVGMVGTVLGRGPGGLGWMGAALLVVALGALRSGVALPGPNPLTPYFGEPASLTGTVEGEPSGRGRATLFRLRLTRVSSGTVGATVLESSLPLVEVAAVGAAAQSLGPGDLVEATGRLLRATPVAERQGARGALSFPVLQRVISAQRSAMTASNPFDRLRQSVEDGFGRYLPSPQGPLALGTLLGGTAGLSEQARLEMRTAGLGHLVAVSGYNVVVVAALVGVVSRRILGRWWSIPLSITGIVLYTGLVGAPASAIRAALMACAALLGTAVGRVADPLTSLVLAAVAMALFDPAVLADVGFQLSFAATLGLVLLHPRIAPAIARTRLPRWAAEPLSLTLSAELATLPLLLVQFSQVSVVAPVANVFAAPLIPWIMAASFGLALSLPFGELGAVTAWAVWLPATLLSEVARLASQLPRAMVYLGNVPPAAGVAMTVPVLAWGLLGLPEGRDLLDGARLRWRRRRLPARLAAGVLSAALVASGIAAAARPDSAARVEVMALGRGYAAAARLPEGATIVVVSGRADPTALASAVAELLPPWERQLDLAVALDVEGRVALTEALRRYPPRTLVEPGGSDTLELPGGQLAVAADRADGGGSAALRFGALTLALGGRSDADADLRIRTDRDGLVGVETRSGDVWDLWPVGEDRRVSVLADGEQVWRAR